MPTGNEFSDVRFGQQDQSYKQTDREMSGGLDPRMEGPDGPSSPGSYPRTFDGQAGEEPKGQESDDNPFYYPNRAFEYIACSGPGQSYVTTERESISGEFNMCRPGETGPYPGTDMVPEPVESMGRTSRPITYPTGPKMNAYGNNILGPHPESK